MYNEQWNELHSNARYQPQYPNDNLVRFVFRNFSSRGGSKILDLGCGAGRHVVFLAQNGYDTYGIDYSPNGIKATKERLNKLNLKADLKVGSVDQIDYSDESFDGVICWGVLLYNDINAIQKAAQEIYRVLKKDAKAIISLRTIHDYRYKNGEKLSKYYAKINESDPSKAAYSENGMNMYFFDENEVYRVFAYFKHIEIFNIRVSNISKNYADDDFALIVEK